MKAKTKVYGDYEKSIYCTGKHEFFSVPYTQYLNLYNSGHNDINVSFQAEDIFINGIRINNDTFQKIINVYAGRQQKAKRLTRRVNEIKSSEPLKNIYDACKQAHRELKI